MTIGKNIYELRKKNKLSQEEIAEKNNVTRQTISNWETGQTVPDLYQSKALANVLNISIDELVESKDAGEETKEKFNEINVEKNINGEELVDASNIWNELKPHLLEYNMSQTGYEIWFEPIVEAREKGTQFMMYTEEELAVRHINEYYQDILLKAIQTYYSKDIKEVKVELIIKQQS